MKKLLIAGALVMAVAVAAAVFVIPSLAHGATSGAGTNSHAYNTPFTSQDVFRLEHTHGAQSANTGGNGVSAGHHSAFSFTCTDYGADQGNRIVSVSESIVNDMDSGEAGNYWAYDTTRRSITIWSAGPNQYCAVVNYYDSTFQAIAGQTSPGKGGTLTGDEHGSFAGSALFTITGAFDASNTDTWPTFGVVNHGAAIDYQCPVSGPPCPGYENFLDQYFATGYQVDEPQWGWTYVGTDGAHNPPSSAGVWVNAYTGNSGDILGN